ncbi:hypothetical protein [Endozoicomonas atrinae]|uniref:hypothetical protein n=1 Tax=Endozoicomonas atrinae TaxID=1333660 RepID=UPI000A60BD08
MAVNQLTKDINTTCAYCGVGCGISARVVDSELHLIEIKGREDHPANYGRLCSKGSALGETVSLDGRLLYPKVHGRQVVRSSGLKRWMNWSHGCRKPLSTMGRTLWLFMGQVSC